jgi:4-hydroxy-tetrahydrodipicolinate synthase
VCSSDLPAAYLANKVVKAFIQGDLKEATRLQLQFACYPNRWMGHGLTPTMKASFKLMGLSAGDPYPPHPPIGGEDLKALEAFLKTTDFPIK